MPVIIIGGGITGLVLALSLKKLGIACRVYEAASEFRKVGVGINLLPHAVRELKELGLLEALSANAVSTREMCFYNRFGQFIHKEARGSFAGYEWPQLSIHRGELHRVQYEAVLAALGPDSVQLNHRCERVEQDAGGVTVHFAGREPVRGSVAVACDGIHSVVRQQCYPGQGPHNYAGINMWRGVTRWKPFLTGASMVQIGWLDVGKAVIYPIESRIDEQGLQLHQWTAEIRSPRNVQADWNLGGKYEDFMPKFESFRFDWLDVAAFLRASELVLEFPMVDRDPVDRWSFGRITLVGDAAHPMYPRGGNGAGQGILDARALAGCLARESDPVAALKAYEDVRLKAANGAVLASRNAPPDTILRLVHERSGDKPFGKLEDIVSAEEIAATMDSYKRAAGFQREALTQRGALA